MIVDPRLNELADVINSDEIIYSIVNPDRVHAWLVSAPKSGSTWLSNLVREATGWHSNFLCNGWERREQEIDLRRMLLHPNENLFSEQQHCRFSAQTCTFVNRCGVRVILLGRNIFDTLVSYSDHLVKESIIVPAAYVPESYLDWDTSRQLDFVIDLIAPWYFNFYCGWFEAQQKGLVSFLWVSYENLVENPTEQMQEILKYLDLTMAQEELNLVIQGVSSRPNRLNVGKSGRGQTVLSSEQRERVYRLASYYSQIDLTRVGL